MKFNQWTLGLAALGVVSLASATQARADSAPAPNYVESATKGISISGYVDTSLDVALTDGSKFINSPMGSIPFEGQSKQDGFDLNVVELNIEHDVDATPWASGFKVSLLAGPDAVGYNTSVNARTSISGTAGTNSVSAAGSTLADFGIKQAYVELMAPLGNGLDMKLGVFDTIIGYEVFESGNNPNFTRSWGYDLEPTEHTGLLLTYKFSDMVSASFGVANILAAGIDGRNNYLSQDSSAGSSGASHYWWKTLMGSVTVTAPNSWGFLGGSSFYLGVVNGYNPNNTLGSQIAGLENSGSAFAGNGTGEDQMNLYAGAVVNTPLKELTTGFAFDYVNYQTWGTDYDEVFNFGLYATYKATDKLSFNGRAEFGWLDFKGNNGESQENDSWYGLTGTVEYDLWANIMARLELRYEANDNGSATAGPSGGSFADGTKININPIQNALYSCGLGAYLNIIYKF